ncbi:6-PHOSPHOGLUCONOLACTONASE [Ceraceosorus bombacis]|uniref:6-PHOSPHOGLUCONOLACTONASE n=1 Tax=Ceraceosorus bombacis TaxID=401625 RepID=A0A0P1BJ93_9BASI|nr:6-PHOSPHOGLUCONOLACTONASE [Ceraceosorus bombacis]
MQARQRTPDPAGASQFSTRPPREHLSRAEAPSNLSLVRTPLGSGANGTSPASAPPSARSISSRTGYSRTPGFSTRRLPSRLAGTLQAERGVSSAVSAHRSPEPHSPTYFITAVPPLELPTDSPHSRNLSIAGSASHRRRGVLLPLYPTLGGQLYAIARECGLPSIGGLAVFLCDDGEGNLGPRIGEAAWASLWSRYFEEESSPDEAFGRHRAARGHDRIPSELSGQSHSASSRSREEYGSNVESDEFDRSVSKRASPAQPRHVSSEYPLAAHDHGYGLTHARREARNSSRRSVSRTSQASRNRSEVQSGRLPIVGRIEWMVEEHKAPWWPQYLDGAERRPLASAKSSISAAGGRRSLHLGVPERKGRDAYQVPTTVPSQTVATLRSTGSSDALRSIVSDVATPLNEASMSERSSPLHQPSLGPLDADERLSSVSSSDEQLGRRTSFATSRDRIDSFSPRTQPPDAPTMLGFTQLEDEGETPSTERATWQHMTQESEAGNSTPVGEVIPGTQHMHASPAPAPSPDAMGVQQSEIHTQGLDDPADSPLTRSGNTRAPSHRFDLFANTDEEVLAELHDVRSLPGPELARQARRTGGNLTLTDQSAITPAQEQRNRLSADATSALSLSKTVSARAVTPNHAQASSTELYASPSRGGNAAVQDWITSTARSPQLRRRSALAGELSLDAREDDHDEDAYEGELDPQDDVLDVVSLWARSVTTGGATSAELPPPPVVLHEGPTEDSAPAAPNEAAKTAETGQLSLLSPIALDASGTFEGPRPSLGDLASGQSPSEPVDAEQVAAKLSPAGANDSSANVEGSVPKTPNMSLTPLSAPQLHPHSPGASSSTDVSDTLMDMERALDLLSPAASADPRSPAIGTPSINADWRKGALSSRDDLAKARTLSTSVTPSPRWLSARGLRQSQAVGSSSRSRDVEVVRPASASAAQGMRAPRRSEILMPGSARELALRVRDVPGYGSSNDSHSSSIPNSAVAQEFGLAPAPPSLAELEEDDQSSSLTHRFESVGSRASADDPEQELGSDHEERAALDRSATTTWQTSPGSGQRGDMLSNSSKRASQTDDASHEEESREASSKPTSPAQSTTLLTSLSPINHAAQKRHDEDARSASSMEQAQDFVATPVAQLPDEAFPLSHHELSTPQPPRQETLGAKGGTASSQTDPVEETTLLTERTGILDNSRSTDSYFPQASQSGPTLAQEGLETATNLELDEYPAEEAVERTPVVRSGWDPIPGVSPRQNQYTQTSQASDVSDSDDGSEDDEDQTVDDIKSASSFVHGPKSIRSMIRGESFAASSAGQLSLNASPSSHGAPLAGTETSPPKVTSTVLSPSSISEEPCMLPASAAGAPELPPAAPSSASEDESQSEDQWSQDGSAADDARRLTISRFSHSGARPNSHNSALANNFALDEYLGSASDFGQVRPRDEPPAMESPVDPSEPVPSLSGASASISVDATAPSTSHTFFLQNPAVEEDHSSTDDEGSIDGRLAEMLERIPQFSEHRRSSQLDPTEPTRSSPSTMPHESLEAMRASTHSAVRNALGNWSHERVPSEFSSSSSAYDSYRVAQQRASRGSASPSSRSASPQSRRPSTTEVQPWARTKGAELAASPGARLASPNARFRALPPSPSLVAHQAQPLSPASASPLSQSWRGPESGASTAFAVPPIDLADPAHSPLSATTSNPHTLIDPASRLDSDSHASSRDKNSALSSDGPFALDRLHSAHTDLSELA